MSPVRKTTQLRLIAAAATTKYPGIKAPKRTYLVWVLAALLISASSPSIAADRPLAIDLAYIGEVWRNIDGGIDTGSEYLDSLDITVEAHLGPGMVYLHGLYNNGGVLSERRVGDAQVISNIDNGEVFRLFEAWYGHSYFDDRASIKLGLIGLDSEFDVIDTAGLFINSSHGTGAELAQTGENGPSIFPSTSLAVRFIYQPTPAWTFRLGAFDAVPNDPDDPDRMSLSLGDGALLIGEGNYTSPSGLRFGLGTWGYTSKFDTLDPNDIAREDGNWGAYGFVEGDIGENLRGWARYGIADNTDINPIESYLGGGLVYTGLFAGRPSDQVGLAVATAYAGSATKAVARQADESVSDSEINVELSYRAQITDWLALQPDIQYVINPGIVDDSEDAFVVGLRFELTFGF